MKTKKCKGFCGKTKDLDEFYINKKSKDGHQNICKKCSSETHKKYNKNNREKLAGHKRKRYKEDKNFVEKVKKQNKKYYHNNKEQRNEYNRQYYKNNKDIIKIQNEKYRENNKRHISLHNKQYYKNNEQRIKVRSKQYYKNNRERINDREKQRFQNNIQFRLAKYIRSRIQHSIKNKIKAGSAVKDLGCSVAELKQYLESKFYPHSKTGEMMTWENYGLYGWHIDHIVPLSSFDLTNRDQFLKACHYTNLQPLWAEENLRKSNKIY